VEVGQGSRTEVVDAGIEEVDRGIADVDRRCSAAAVVVEIEGVGSAA